MTVAWLYSPAGTGWMRTKLFSFGAGIFDYVPGPDEDLRATLQRWADGFRNDPFTADASSVGVSAWSVDYEQAVQNIDLLTDRLANVLSELKSL